MENPREVPAHPLDEKISEIDRFIFPSDDEIKALTPGQIFELQADYATSYSSEARKIKWHINDPFAKRRAELFNVASAIEALGSPFPLLTSVAFNDAVRILGLGIATNRFAAQYNFSDRVTEQEREADVYSDCHEEAREKYILLRLLLMQRDQLIIPGL